ncbi:MAG TPA: HypC/HybG/HupF family hydrogenase formation chaperone [Armatimonadota bacterium]|nr:HypC/HybG/HupF family hydrogenase formation chaperone [Armatimonadota bacterium]
MCLAVPGQVIHIDGTTATVDVMGVTREVSIDFTTDVAVGDYLMVHAGYAIEKLDMEEALRTIELFKELDAIMDGGTDAK